MATTEFKGIKKRWTGALLLFSLCAPLLINGAWLQLTKAKIRKEVKQRIIEGISRDELQFLSFTTWQARQLLKWEHSNEFEYQGEMYDVVATEVCGDTVKYWCWWDNKESRLNKLMTAMLSDKWQNNPLKKENQKQLSQFLNGLFYQKFQPHTVFYIPITNTINNRTDFYQSVLLMVDIPPPKL